MTGQARQRSKNQIRPKCFTTSHICHLFVSIPGGSWIGETMRTIDLIFIDSGGGHRAAAAALAEVIRRQQRPWDLRLLNIQDLLDSIDIIRKSTGIQFHELYNIMLRRNW